MQFNFFDHVLFSVRPVRRSVRPFVCLSVCFPFRFYEKGEGGGVKDYVTIRAIPPDVLYVLVLKLHNKMFSMSFGGLNGRGHF